MKNLFITLFLLFGNLSFLFASNIEEKIDLYKESIDTITQFYQWSFLLVFIMLILFIGGNFFNNRSKIKTELEQKKKELEEIAERERRIIIKLSDDKISALDKKVTGEIHFFESKYDLAFLELDFNSQQVVGTKLSLSLKILSKLSFLYGEYKYWDHAFQKYLSFILDELNKGNKFSYHEADEVNTSLQSLPERFSTQVNKIFDILEYES